MKSQQEHIEEYQSEGYTVFENYLDSEKVASLRAVLDPEFSRHHAEDPNRPRATISSILGHERLASPLSEHILNPRLLDFAEAVMGPYVQLDSMEISGYPSVGIEEKGKVAGWHRDAFNLTEQWVNYPFTYQRQPRFYTPPMACNCLTYLQNMTLDSGPLRVVQDLIWIILISLKRHTTNPTPMRSWSVYRRVIWSLPIVNCCIQAHSILRARSVTLSAPISRILGYHTATHLRHRPSSRLLPMPANAMTAAHYVSLGSMKASTKGSRLPGSN